LFDLFSYCSDESIRFSLFEQIEFARKSLLHSGSKIKREDFGAGSITGKLDKVSQVAATSLSSPFQCRFLSRLIQFSSAEKVLELGTSLGISAAYFSAGSEEASIVTVEGDQGIHVVASDTLENLSINNVRLIHATFEDYFENYFDSTEKLDIVFIDGNHRKEPLLRYFERLQPAIHEGSILVIDDIYWSKEMQDGWKQLIAHPRITQSVDCFSFGLLFFRNDFMNRQNHKVRLPFIHWRKK
jgi:predicted O-methyltransferase YrrM